MSGRASRFLGTTKGIRGIGQIAGLRVYGFAVLGMLVAPWHSVGVARMVISNPRWVEEQMYFENAGRTGMLVLGVVGIGRLELEQS